MLLLVSVLESYAVNIHSVKQLLLFCALYGVQYGFLVVLNENCIYNGNYSCLVSFTGSNNTFSYSYCMPYFKEL